MRSDQHYTLLLSDVSSDDLEKKSNEHVDFHHSSSRQSRRELILYRCIILVQLVVFSVTMIWAFISKNARQDGSLFLPQSLYSPAQDVLEYEPKRFTFGVHNDTTIYQGEPSTEIDNAWDALYNRFGLSRIPKEQARLLPNKTLPIPGDEEHYAVALSVFHQLHCLNIIRKSLWREHYTDPVAGTIAGIKANEWTEHISHCLDGIRQSLMCSADISSIVWQWSELDNQASPRTDVVQSCRNFDKIADWAKAHTWDRGFDLFTHVEDDIEIPVF